MLAAYCFALEWYFDLSEFTLFFQQPPAFRNDCWDVPLAPRLSVDGVVDWDAGVLDRIDKVDVEQSN